MTSVIENNVSKVNYDHPYFIEVSIFHRDDIGGIETYRIWFVAEQSRWNCTKELNQSLLDVSNRLNKRLFED